MQVHSVSLSGLAPETFGFTHGHLWLPLCLSCLARLCVSASPRLRGDNPQRPTRSYERRRYQKQVSHLCSSVFICGSKGFGSLCELCACPGDFRGLCGEVRAAL